MNNAIKMGDFSHMGAVSINGYDFYPELTSNNVSPIYGLTSWVRNSVLSSQSQDNENYTICTYHDSTASSPNNTITLKTKWNKTPVPCPFRLQQIILINLHKRGAATQGRTKILGEREMFDQIDLISVSRTIRLGKTEIIGDNKSSCTYEYRDQNNQNRNFTVNVGF